MNNQPHIIASCDISAQEPTWVILLSKESQYFPVFRNKTIREMDLNIYIDFVFSKEFGFDPESYDSISHKYWIWVYNKFHWNYTPLDTFNKNVEKMKGGDKEAEEKVREQLNEWFDDFREFLDSFNKKE